MDIKNDNSVFTIEVPTSLIDDKVETFCTICGEMTQLYAKKESRLW